MEATILRHVALEEIDSGKPFKLEFITCDRRRGTGGELKQVVNWVKVKGDPADIRLPGRQIKKSELNDLRRASGIKEFNIYNPLNPSDHIKKVHYRLMVFFNGKRIID